MRIAVLSGKGGTGKTFVATNLAAISKGAVYVDCDVEEPNGRLFLPCDAPKRSGVCVLLPRFQEEKCIGCRACVQFCEFNALAFIGKKPKVFREVCHSCGGCKLVCPSDAIAEIPVSVGVVEVGKHHDTTVVSGILNVGEASGVPVIRQALKEAFAMSSPLTVIDCPPGSACTVTESISASDYCLLVTEPTVFGLHNLRMVTALAKAVGKPCGVVLNKADGAYPMLEAFCKEEGLPILLQIPYQKEIARGISSGKLLSETDAEVHRMFQMLLEALGGVV